MSIEKFLSSNAPSPKLLNRLLAMQNFFLIVVMIVTGAIFCAWMFPLVARALPLNWHLMKANTSLAMLLASMTIYFLMKPTQHYFFKRWLTRLSAFIIVFIATINLFEALSGVETGIDTFLINDATSFLPGGMSFQTASFLAIIGLILLFDSLWKKRKLLFIADTLTTLLIMIILIISAEYCFNTMQFFGSAFELRTSPQSLICMYLLTFSTLGYRSSSGFFSVLIGVGIGSQIARTAFPFALIVPIVIICGGAYMTTTGLLSSSFSAPSMTSLLSGIFSIFVIFMSKKINHLEQALRDMSLKDELTQIYNRRGFYLLGEHLMQECIRNKTPLTILFFDLDGLKRVNDTQGHEVGSKFILDFSKLLRTTFRESDVIGRVGGDEFSVIICCCKQEAMTALKRLNQATELENKQQNNPYMIRFSVGDFTFEPSNKESPLFEDLVAKADAAMYKQKQLKKAQPHLFIT